MALEPTQSELQWDEVLLEEAAERFGTPLYLYSAATMLDAFSAYEQAFSTIPHRICYALGTSARRAKRRSTGSPRSGRGSAGPSGWRCA